VAFIKPIAAEAFRPQPTPEYGTVKVPGYVLFHVKFFFTHQAFVSNRHACGLKKQKQNKKLNTCPMSVDLRIIMCIMIMCLK
jgi:hypothetical protein